MAERQARQKDRTSPQDGPPLEEDRRSRQQSGFRVSQIQLNEPDSLNKTVTRIYAVKDGEYAVYKTDDVFVHFADDPADATKQHSRVAQLGPARYDINNLLDRWKQRDFYDGQIAAALQLALDDDLPGAQRVLDGANADLLAEHAAAGRFQYMQYAVLSCAVMLGVLYLCSTAHPFANPASNVWLAGNAGLVGAWFSIALALRSRTVALDTDWRSNAMDGVLRLAIGVISAGVLLLLLASGVLPNFSLGGATIAGDRISWETVVLIGFVAGFLERLVPDLLDKDEPTPVGTPPSGAAAAM